MMITTFKIGDQVFGADILHVKEICHLQAHQVVPGAKEFHYGLVNLRGHVISVIMPSLFLGHNSSATIKKNLLIFKTDEDLESLNEDGAIKNRESFGKDRIALMIDSVLNVKEVEDNHSMSAPTSNIPEKLAQVISNVVCDDSQLIFLIDIEKFITMVHSESLNSETQNHDQST